MDDKRRLILDQALALVDESGLAAMSMRAVAARVGLTSMALYPYVGGKDALLDGLVDLLHLELGSSYGDDPADIDWRQRLRALGRAVRALAHTHPGAFPLLLNRAAAGASASWLTAALRATLHDAGVPEEQVPRLARMICAFFLGYATGEVTGGLPGTPGTAGLGGAESDGPGGVAGKVRPGGEEADRPGGNAGAGDPGGGAEGAGQGGGQAAGPGDAAGALIGDEASARAAPVGGQGSASAEFDADLDDLVRMVEVAVRVA